VVTACMAMDKNARVQLQAMQLGDGDYVPLAPGEITRPWVTTVQPPLPDRAWELWVRRAGF
jgi:hypothetical protein